MRRFMIEWCPVVLAYELLRDTVWAWRLGGEWVWMETCEYIDQVRQELGDQFHDLMEESNV